MISEIAIVATSPRTTTDTNTTTTTMTNMTASANTATTTTTTTTANNANNNNIETTTTSPSTTMPSTTEQTLSATPVTKRSKARHSPYTKPNPILLSSDRRSRHRKSLSWLSDDKIHKIHYFEYIADERINVTRPNNADQQNDANASAGSSSLNANNKSPIAVGGKISNASVDPVRRSSGKNDSDKCVEYAPWRPLVLIDFTPELPSPGWNSLERSTQAERETYVLGAIDLPGQPSTLDEPDQALKPGPSNGTSTSSANEPTSKDGASTCKIIPTDSVEGMYTEYPEMYTSEIVNGVKMPTDNPQPVVQNIASFCNQQSQLIPNQFQQQLVHATQNPFNFQDMGAQFQQQAQLQIQFPFQQQQRQQPVQRFQQPIMPFTNQQQQLQVQPQQQQQSTTFVDPQSGLTGPVMPWLSYPFNQVNENSHAHLFRRPAT